LIRGKELARALSLCAISMLAILASCSTTQASDGQDAVSGASPAGSTLAAISAGDSAGGDGKKTLVVYFSQGSATKHVAEDVAIALSADVERILEKKPRKAGFAGFMSAGADSSMGKATPIQTPASDPALYDRVVVCTPVWAWHLAPPVRSWLRLMRDRLPETAFIMVSADTKPKKIIAMMTKESGKTPAAWASFVEKDFAENDRTAYETNLNAFLDKLY